MQSGTVEVTSEQALDAMKLVVGDAVQLEYNTSFSSKNKMQKVKVTVGSVTKEANANLTLVPNKKIVKH